MLDVDEILKESKEDLMMLVPSVTSSHSYEKVFRENYHWYQIIINLSEKLTDSRKRAKKHGLQHNLNLHYLCELWIDQRGRCALIGVPMDHQSGSLLDKNPFRFGIDRIDNDQGYIVGNVRLTCHWSNNAKSTWDDDTFKQCVIQAYKFMEKSQC
jgi:hypothetical protein